MASLTPAGRTLSVEKKKTDPECGFGARGTKIETRPPLSASLSRKPASRPIAAKSDLSDRRLSRARCEGSGFVRELSALQGGGAVARDGDVEVSEHRSVPDIVSVGGSAYVNASVMTLAFYLQNGDVDQIEQEDVIDMLRHAESHSQSNCTKFSLKLEIDLCQY